MKDNRLSRLQFVAVMSGTVVCVCVLCPGLVWLFDPTAFRWPPLSAFVIGVVVYAFITLGWAWLLHEWGDLK